MRYGHIIGEQIPSVAVDVGRTTIELAQYVKLCSKLASLLIHSYRLYCVWDYWVRDVRPLLLIIVANHASSRCYHHQLCAPVYHTRAVTNVTCAFW